MADTGEEAIEKIKANLEEVALVILDVTMPGLDGWHTLARLRAAFERVRPATLRLLDRGLLAPGHKADVNIIDFDRLQLKAPYMVYDLPTGARRLMQEADGYVATIKSGQVVMSAGETTGELPGQLLRGAR